MGTISQNQYDYLNGLVKSGGGNGEWAKSQLNGVTVEKPQTTTPAITTTTPTTMKPQTPTSTPRDTPGVTIEKPATMQPGYGGAIAEIIPSGGVISAPTSYAAASRPTIDIGGITNGVRADIMNQVNQQVLAAQQGLGQMTQANQLAVTENKNYLDDQIAKMTKQKANDMDNAVSFQNRRGGFYSGGIDYQQGQINSSYGEAQGTLTRDVTARNQDIWNRNALLAQQTAEKITQLQQQAPDLIRKRIDELVNQQLAERNAQSAQTGYMADGTPTLQMQEFMNNKKAANEEALAKDKKARIDYAQNLQKTFGVPIVVKNDYGLMDEQVKGLTPTSEKDKQMKNALDVSDKLGYVTAELSQATGIPVGTPMLEAQKFLDSSKMGWYNANTSRMNAGTSAANAANSNAIARDKLNWDMNPNNPSNAPKAKTTDFKSDPNFAADVAHLRSDSAAASQLEANAEAFINAYGYDGYKELRKAAGLDD